MAQQMKDIPTAYKLWLGALFGVAGLHRLYTGKILTGFLWLFTFGLFGIGQIVDLLLIPRMVELHNSHQSTKLAQATAPDAGLFKRSASQTLPTTSPLPQEAVIQLLKAAEAAGGKLSVTQGVMATGASFTEVEVALKQMVQTGYVEVGNHPSSGIIVYEFKEMLEG